MHGIEWIVEAHGCTPERLRDLITLKNLFAQIVADLDLRPVGETQWHQFPASGGITGLCLLSESHLTCHTFPEYGSACLNVFCCRPRGEWDFGGNLRRLLDAESVSVQSIARRYVDAQAAMAVTGPGGMGPRSER
jgi:S-adenosylmethionine decarboxylase